MTFYKAKEHFKELGATLYSYHVWFDKSYIKIVHFWKDQLEIGYWSFNSGVYDMKIQEFDSPRQWSARNIEHQQFRDINYNEIFTI